MVLYQGTEKRLEYERVISLPYSETERAMLDQQSRLQEYEKLANIEEHGKSRPAYRIPIEEAMKKVLADWQSGALPEASPAESTSPAGTPQTPHPAETLREPASQQPASAAEKKTDVER
jgi:hypothetical protein